MRENRIYFDNAASTMVDPGVAAAMAPYVSEIYGNASSLHYHGRLAKEALEKSRAVIAGSVGADPGEVIFTSGGTESNNFALIGTAFANLEKGRHIIVSAIEHDSVISPGKWLDGIGFEVTYLPVDQDGMVDVRRLECCIRRDTVLVSVMHANNEIGMIQPIEKIGAVCREHGILFHTDACQSYGKIGINLHRQNIDLLSVNAHKIYGPKGVGALVVGKDARIDPYMHGGGHEKGLRSSTENIPGIVGFARAAEICLAGMEGETARISSLRDRIIDYALGNLPGAYLNGDRTRRLPGNVNLSFRGYEGEAIRLLMILDSAGISVSTGSACSSNSGENSPSHVLSAIGRDPFQARGALRITLGRFNTEDEVDSFLHVLTESMNGLKPISH